MGGITSHLGHKVILGSSMVSRNEFKRSTVFFGFNVLHVSVEYQYVVEFVIPKVDSIYSHYMYI